MKKNIVNLIFAIIIMNLYILLIGFGNKSYAISIDETRYPGYKTKIEALQKQYPNWDIRLFYTGLKWNDVLNGENTGHGGSPTSLTYYTYNGEWICPTCGYKLYDVSKEWYCASREAISYMMDPRNSLTVDYMFQFQNLSSSSGTRAEVEKMLQGTFLSKPSCVTAIMEAAKEYNISPFHLISRITQEQGTSGIGNMNGYIYTTEDGKKIPVYNLYNIKVSGNNANEGFLAGAKFAYEQGWFTQEASIKGGAKFLREEYLDKGQTTLYFQKYNVVNKNNLYKHQYMQNIRAANDEGNSIYRAYSKSGVLNSHFEFVIPVYENMPVTASARPLTSKDTYKGDIAGQITQISLNANEKGEHYIKGEINITEWLNGVTWSVPKATPIMRLKDSRGNYVDEFWVKKLESNRYYFDVYVENLNPNDTYIIEIESGSSQNISNYRKGNASYNKNIQLGRFRRSALCIENSKLVFKPVIYNGDVATSVSSISLSKNSSGNTYIKGNLLISEWIGTTWTIPDVLPTIKLKAKDGSKILAGAVKLVSGNNYYFDVCIDGINVEKDYVLEVQLQNSYNQSKYKKAYININKQIQLGKYGTSTVYIKNDTLIFEQPSYVGDVAGEITSFSLNKNSQGKSYVKGEILITEWLNGVTWSAPKKLPKMRIEDTNGKLLTELWVLKLEGNKYYFDGYIEGIDTSKSYIIKIESGSSNNISKYKTVKAYYAKGETLGIYKNYSMQIKNSIITFKSSQYIGDLASEIINLSLQKNTQGKTYIKGEIIITEWINGAIWSIPRKLPKMKIEDTNGNIVTELWVLKLESNKYYFDGYIEGIDTSKSYYIEIESGSSENVSKYKIVKAYYAKNVTLGTYKNTKVLWKNNQLQFSGIQYIGDVANEIQSLKITTKNGKQYLTGEIIVTEWLNGITWSVPNTLPIIRLKASDGTQIQAMTTKKTSNYYIYECEMSKINLSKTYTIEVESGNSNNQSKYRKVIGNYARDGVIGIYNSKQVKISKNVISFK